MTSQWIIVQLALALVLLVLSFNSAMKPVWVAAYRKAVENITSKRFTVLMIATWFVYKGIAIDGNWMILAAAYIGMDTAHKAGVLAALADKLRNNNGKKGEQE